MSDAEDDYFGTSDTIDVREAGFDLSRDFWRKLGPNDPNLVLGDAALEAMEAQKMTTAPLPASRRRRLLEQEAERHEKKAELARARAEALDDLPDVDPFPSPTVLMVIRDGYTFAVLKIAGHWYTTGTVLRLNRADWEQFIIWLADAKAIEIYPMVRGAMATLGELIPRPEPENILGLRIAPCTEVFVENDHLPHAWGQDGQRPVFWCDGFIRLTASG